MENKFVRAVLDIDCEWQGLPPSYRIYVNDDLFTERTWRYNNEYLEETLQISAPPGMYKVRLEPVQPCLAKFYIKSMRIDFVPAQWLDENQL